MRILFTVHGYKPSWRIGGPVLSVSALAEGLVKRGHDVQVFATNFNLDQDLDVSLDEPARIEGVTVRYFPRTEPLKRWFPRIPYLAKSIGTLYSPQMTNALHATVPSVDLVHTHMPFIYPTYAAARAAFRHGRPLFYHQRGVFDPQRLRFRSVKKAVYMRLVERPILRRATTLIALTAAERESYRRLGVTTPCRVIPNGIDVNDYLCEFGAGALEGLRIKPDDIVVLFLGRVHPIKGADCLLDAFLAVHERMPRALLVMAGPDEYGLEKRFKSTVARHGLAGRVVFPGMVEGLLKKQLLARADLFCLPSVGEGFSMAILEALASETAVLISPGCHFPEVESAGAGLICERNADALSSALLGLLPNAHILREMGRRGRKLVEQKYGWPRICEQMIETYEEGLQRHGGVGP